MFSQERTGRFIAECRKEKGLTQRELAEKLSLSDKTISKWETGNGMPDSAIMQPLCELLGINVNELLSGEKLSEGSYNGKAEEIMVELIKENEQAKGSKIGTTIVLVLGLLMSAVAIVGTIGLQPRNIAYFLDIPSLFYVIGFLLLCLGLAGRFNDFCMAFSYCFGKRRKYTDYDSKDRRRAAQAMKMSARISLLAGAIGSIFGAVMSLALIGSPEQIGPHLAVAVLTLFYAFIISMIFTTIKGRIES